MSYNESGEPIYLGSDIPDSTYQGGKRTYYWLGDKGIEYWTQPHTCILVYSSGQYSTPKRTVLIWYSYAGCITPGH